MYVWSCSGVESNEWRGVVRRGMLCSLLIQPIGIRQRSMDKRASNRVVLNFLVCVFFFFVVAR